MRPGHTEVLLFVILIGAFAEDDVVGDEPLPRVLPARGEVVSLSRGFQSSRPE